MLFLLLLSLLRPAAADPRQDPPQPRQDPHHHVSSPYGGVVGGEKEEARPYIYHCRSPNMEDFTCWWRPPPNLTEHVDYVFTYSKDEGPVLECPDYVGGGAYSCHFDRSHTSIWKMYCMNVTAVAAHRNYSSQQQCLDVAGIVQTEAPVNLTYQLVDVGGDELGHTVMLTWAYPVPSDLQYGWITLVYELRYRRAAERHNWKVKQPLREPGVELLGLPVGDYVVQVRSRSHNSGLWSSWSSQLAVSIPARAPAGQLLVVMVVLGAGLVVLLVVLLSVVPQSQRIKNYFLPPIPKPRIIGIDPLLLKKGHLDEINRHFSGFHNYAPPRYEEEEEVWDSVSADHVYLTKPKGGVDVVGVATVSSDAGPLAARRPSVAPYCSLPPDSFPPSSPPPEIVSVPGTDYSIAEPPPAFRSLCRDFYTSVHLMNDGGELHLVPCLPPDTKHNQKNQLTCYSGVTAPLLAKARADPSP